VVQRKLESSTLRLDQLTLGEKTDSRAPISR
jgi:hypothetical protein